MKRQLPAGLRIGLGIGIGLAIGLCAFIAAPALAQGPVPGITQDWSKVDQRIAWHGTWQSALAAAAATERPILLVSAAPHCGLVPGMW